MSHLTTTTTCDLLATALRPRGAGRRLRRGFSSLFAIMFIMICIVTLMLVVNWTYLVLVSRHTLRLSDSLSLTAVKALLDEQVLSDTQAFPGTQTDDITQAQAEITTAGTGFLARNNAAAGANLRPAANQLTITAARIDNAAAAVAAPSNYTTTPAAGQPYNTLVVEILRAPNSMNPVELIFRGQGSDQTAKITSASYATLDSRVVGFRPLTATRSPVAPLALNAAAWFTTRVTNADDSQLPDGRLELDFTLLTSGGLGTANSALISLNNLSALSTGAVANQVTNGIGPADVNNVTGTLGPLTNAAPLLFDSTQMSPAGDLTNIAAAFNGVAASTNPRRAFPIYNGAFTDPSSIVGFIGARVLNADAAGGRLRVRLQPDFVIHSTVETQRTFPGATSVPENLYIHKIRLTR
ncbi:hypothetical protein [Anatilimnocola floriformis]|uniref:hypothetical protein n=1 Tax=Anatilimnocola floriformis TaxID=2948575 RepID=UPI0020C5A8C0|nr:hypothetical protein [Anatilimnocola floriformis]